MRYYGFGNYYLSSIQQGIQNLHVVSDISVKYEDMSEENESYKEWALYHKTVVLCNGGNAESINTLYAFLEELEKEGMDLPYSLFKEDGPSLSGAVTAVGVIVYTRHYMYDKVYFGENKEDIYNNLMSEKDELLYFSKGLELGYKNWELKLMKEIKKYKLAN